MVDLAEEDFAWSRWAFETDRDVSTGHHTKANEACKASPGKFLFRTIANQQISPDSSSGAVWQSACIAKTGFIGLTDLTAGKKKAPGVKGGGTRGEHTIGPARYGTVTVGLCM